MYWCSFVVLWVYIIALMYISVFGVGCFWLVIVFFIVIIIGCCSGCYSTRREELRRLFSLCRQPDEGGVWCKLTQMHRRLHHRNQFRKLKLEMHKSCFYQIFNLYAGEEIPEIERLGWIFFICGCGYYFELPYGEIGSKSP